MPFHVRDPETTTLVRELARRRGCGLTEAVKQAVGNELRREEEKVPLRDRIKALQDEFRAYPATGLKADKAFYDWLNDEEAE
ncbi:MAG TPA: type II toxin-antitoxin system VapB family antitoxin [Caulobacteraceae bacterium]